MASQEQSQILLLALNMASNIPAELSPQPWRSAFNQADSSVGTDEAPECWKKLWCQRMAVQKGMSDVGSRSFHFYYTANVAALWSISECHLQNLKLLISRQSFVWGKKYSYHFQNTEGFVVSKRDSQNKNSLKALAFMQGTKAGSWLSWEASVSLLHTPRLPVLHNRFQKGFLKSQVWQTRAHKQVRVLLSVLSLCSSPQISPGQSKTYGFYHSLSSSTGLPYLANANLKVSKTELRISFKPSSSNFNKLWEMKFSQVYQQKIEDKEYWILESNIYGAGEEAQWLRVYTALPGGPEISS